MGSKGNNFVLLSLSCYLSFISPSHSDTDTLLQGQQLNDGDYLVSASGTFRLGFVSPGSSRNRYLGISYNGGNQSSYLNDQIPVWVANRNAPISDASGVLHIDHSGKLIISSNGASPIVFSSIQTASNASATLLDSGNFILRELNSDGSIKRVLWQSFDYPTNVLLPGMKLGINFKTGHNWSLTSWVSDEVPASGSFTLGGNPSGSRELIIWWQGKVYWTSGLWRDGSFDFLRLQGNKIFSYISNENETYFTYHMDKNHIVSGYRMDYSGIVTAKEGLIIGTCSITGLRNADGCVKETLPECRNGKEYFEEITSYIEGNGLKLDESDKLSVTDCEAKCVNNCSCFAFASTNDNKTGCQIWSRGMDFKIISAGSGNGLVYVLQTHKDATKWKIRLIIAVAGVLFVLVLCSSCYLIRRKLRARRSRREQEILIYEIRASTTHSSKSRKTNKLKGEGKKSHELRFFSFESIASATDNFATTNKLGEGGYGPVYKVHSKCSKI
ncbi:hypothetical protein L1049_005493 [Liquidambar formosana]|uniref:non-specific serine/threonine protein kinase n=1 Tax=Liquidambar formosana TaxID=63359 RepID=A0AAP0RUE1_LIQFO